jgi:hypothetical protein
MVCSLWAGFEAVRCPLEIAVACSVDVLRHRPLSPDRRALWTRAGLLSCRARGRIPLASQGQFPNPESYQARQERDNRPASEDVVQRQLGGIHEFRSQMSAQCRDLLAPDVGTMVGEASHDTRRDMAAQLLDKRSGIYRAEYGNAE